MKKILGPVLLCFPLLASALSVEKIKGQLAYFTYSNDTGEAVATSLDIKLQDSRSIEKNLHPAQKSMNQKILIFRQGNDINVNIGFISVDWEDVPVWLTSELDLAAKNASISLGYENVQSIKAQSASIYKPSIGKAAVEDLSIECVPKEQDRSRFDNLLEQCLEDGTITSRELNIPSLKSFWAQVLEDEMDNTEDLRKVGEDLQVRLYQNRFTLGLKTKVFLRARVKAWGEAKHLEEENKLRIRLDKVKFGRIPLTRIAFAVLETFFEGKDIQINRPYIDLSL